MKYIIYLLIPLIMIPCSFGHGFVNIYCEADDNTFTSFILFDRDFKGEINSSFIEGEGHETRARLSIDLFPVNIRPGHRHDEFYDGFINRVQLRKFEDDILRIVFYSDTDARSLRYNINTDANQVIIRLIRIDTSNVMAKAFERQGKQSTETKDGPEKYIPGKKHRHLHRVFFPIALVILGYNLFSFIFSINVIERYLITKKNSDINKNENEYIKKARTGFLLFLLYLGFLSFLALYCTFIYSNYKNIFNG